MQPKIDHYLIVDQKPTTGSLANIKDPDEMPHDAAFYQGLQCLPRQPRFSEKKLEIETCEPSIYTTDYPVQNIPIVCSSMGNSIGLKMVRNTTASDTCNIRHLILIYYELLIQCIVEPRHEKTNNAVVRLEETRVSVSLVRVLDVHI